MMIPVLETKRLVLRAPERTDFDAYAVLLGDARTQFMGGPYTRHRAWDMLSNMVAGWHLSGFGGWIVTSREGGFLGEVSIWYPDRFPEPELGWTMSAQAEGKGFAFEAATAARDWYRETFNAKTLVSYITPGNTRSEALAQRLGARPDPTAPLPTDETFAETTVWRHDLTAGAA